MFKTLIILFLIGYVIISLNNYIFGKFYRFMGYDPRARYTKPPKNKKVGDLEIFISDEEKRRREKNKDYNGGEYVDYEEVD